MDDLLMQQTEVARCRADMMQLLDNVLRVDLRHMLKFINPLYEHEEWIILDQERAQCLWNVILLNACGSVLVEMEEMIRVHAQDSLVANYFIDKIGEAMDEEFHSFETADLIKTVWGIGEPKAEGEKDVGDGSADSSI